MKTLLMALIIITALVGCATAQTKSSKPATVLQEVLNNLSKPEICGQPEWAERTVYSGRIVKRDFDESELRLSGFVLKDSKDRRVYVNLDTDHISKLSSDSSGALANFLLLGTKVKVTAWKCRKILYAAKITPL